tara:strand:- start:1266 stop:1430 length:165 start_codon:yes stop_codon:yes gene_type:complete
MIIKKIVPVSTQASEMLPSFTKTINSVSAATGGEAGISPLKGFKTKRKSRRYIK